ncbi:MAG: hypothetical protein HC923_03015 [Myxococcales bacterium]|nr:hypothetical protein [Myxococcales bacterium]
MKPFDRAPNLVILLSLTVACGEGVEAGTGSGGLDQDVDASVPGSCSALAQDCDRRCSGSFANVECSGRLSGQYDNVLVPAGAHCDLDAARLTGNLIVMEGATANVGPDVFVCGDLQGDQADRLDLAGLQVCGNLQFEQGGSASMTMAVQVLKNLQISKSASVMLEATRVCSDATFVETGDVEVIGDVTVEKNCSASENGAIDFSGIRILGDNAGCM